MVSATEDSKRSPHDADPGQSPKRRKVHDTSRSPWTFELRADQDETLQLSRLSGTLHHTPHSTFDSYRLETLAVAEQPTPNTQSLSGRWCDTTVSSQHVAVTIGSQIHVLSANCKLQEAVIRHEHPITATALNGDSSFVAFGDDTGTLFIVHIQTRRVVFSQPIQAPNAAGITAIRFAVVHGDVVCEELVVVCDNSTLVRFSEVRLGQLNTAIISANMAMAMEIKGLIRVEFVDLNVRGRRVHGAGISGLVVTHESAMSRVDISGLGGASISSWRRAEAADADGQMRATHLVDLVSEQCSGSGYIKIIASLDQRYLVALSECGSLDVYERSTLTLVFRYTDIPIDDFSLLGSRNSAAEAAGSSASLMVVAVSKPVSTTSHDNNDDDDDDDSDLGDQCRRLFVVSLPQMETIYAMDVSQWTWLATDTRLAADITDAIMFVEGTVNEDTHSLFLRRLYETVPMERLAHYLRDGRYAEAGQFAEECGIPMGRVYRTRLEELVKNSSHATANLCTSEEISLFTDNVFEMLQQLDEEGSQDSEFAIDICLRLSVPSYADTRRLLQHAQQLAIEFNSPRRTVVEKTIQRLGTWLMLRRANSNVSQFSADGWHAFREADLAADLRSYIAKGNISCASTVWRRHQDDERMVTDIAGAIQGAPLNINTQALATWLRQEVLPVIHSAQQWHDVAAWIEQRARSLEAKQRKPYDALALVELLDIGSWSACQGSNGGQDSRTLTEGQFTVTPQSFIDSSQRMSQWMLGLAQFSGKDVGPSDSNTAKVADDRHVAEAQSCVFLHKQLQDLVYLREQHSMQLELEEYDLLSYSMIAVEFLDRVAAPELLRQAYFDHFVPYALSHQLDYPQLLLQYCVSTMDDIDTAGHDAAADGEDIAMISSSAIAPAQGFNSWEPRVLQLLECLAESASGRTQVPGDDTGAAKQPALVQQFTATITRESVLVTFFDITLEVMRRSNIPWSAGVDKAITNSLELLDGPVGVDPELARRKLEIREQYRLMCLKRMLFSYGLPDFHISNTRMAYPLLQWLVRKTDSPGIMADALQLVDAYHQLSRTTAYVLRLQALCEAGDPDKVAKLIEYIDVTEHQPHSKDSHYARLVPTEASLSLDSGTSAARDDQTVSRYVPMEIVRRGLCWIHELLDSMTFTGESSKIQFSQYVEAAMAMIHALDALCKKHVAAAQALAEGTSSQHGERVLPQYLLDKIKDFVAEEKASMGVVWQLLTEGKIMVSPGELEHRSARSQILSELLEQRWLQPYASDRAGAGRSNGKGLQPNRGAINSVALELLSLPPVPTSIRNLAAMLKFSPAQLSQRIISLTLSLGMFSVAIDTCQDLIEVLRPLPSGDVAGQSASAAVPMAAVDDWYAAIGALAKCEQVISAHLAGLHDGTVRTGTQTSALSGSLQGVLIKRLVALSQAASLKCASQSHLVGFLDAFSSWEFAAAIFKQTTDGDFAVLTRKPGPKPKTTQPSSSSRSFPSHAVAGSSSSASLATVYEDANEVDESALSSWLSPLFSNIYVERGLVLETEKTMPLVYRLITLLRRLPTTTTELKPGAKATVDAQRNGQSKSSGKSADDRDISNLGELETDGLRSEATSCCRSLVAHLSANRHWILAIQALELTISQLARSSFVVSVDVEESVESLSLLRQRLSSGGVSEHELEALFGTHETANPLDIQSLAGKSLVRSLQQQRGIDTVFIFSAMIMTPPVKAYQYLSTAMSHSGLLPSRVITLANIGAACSLVWQQQALLDRCRSVAAAARWSEQLQLLHIKFDVALLNDPKPQMLETLIRPMLAKTSMDITTVLEFAEEFRLDEAFVILEYISLCCSMPGIDGYQARILGIADEVANTKLLERTYADAMENGISAYDYEHLQFVVQRLHELRPQDEAVANYMATLDILCSYDRHCKPEAEELALEWTRTRAARETLQQFAGAGDSAEQDTGHTPPISVLVAQYPLATKRLPFHSLVNSDPWAVLLPELGVDTIDLLVALAKPLGLNQDDFYMNLIDSMLKQWKCSSPPELTREMAFAVATSKTPTHFNAIQPLIRCFKDPEAAVSTLKHVADELPCGPDRLAALKMGIKFLKKWAQYIRRMSEPERSEVLVKAETIYSHFEKSYADALVEVALRKHGLEQYLRLFTDAQGSEATLRALTAVYEGQCDVAVREAKHNGRHALHEVVRALADIYGFEMDKLLKKMLDTYLETAIVLDDSTASLLLPSTRYQASLRMPVSWEAQLRRRIVYILRAYSVSELVTLLLRFAYNNHGGISCLCRARALDIVLSLVSEKDIAALQSPGHVKRYFQALLYLADFEFVGIPQSTADFVECSKPALARSIWVDYHEDPKVVQLICNMCLDFGIEDSDLLSRIIPRLLAAKVFRYVTGALEIVGRMPHYSTIPELPMFWNQAVAGSLVQISEDRAPTWVEDSASVLSACIRSLYLPDIDTCNIVSLLLQCAEEGTGENSAALQLAFAAYEVLPSNSDTAELLQKHIGSCSPELVHKNTLLVLELAELSSKASNSQLFVDWSESRALTLIFDNIDSRGLHEQVLLRPPVGRSIRAYVRNRMHNDKLVAAVQACLNRGKQRLAQQIVCQYYSTRPADALIADAASAGIEPDLERTEIMDVDGDENDALQAMSDPGTPPLGEENLAPEVRRLAKRFSETIKLDIYLASHN